MRKGEGCGCGDTPQIKAFEKIRERYATRMRLCNKSDAYRLYAPRL